MSHIGNTGALIENGTLRDVDANAASVAAAPSCQIAFLPDEDTEDNLTRNLLGDSLRSNDSEDTLNIPVYSSPRRDVLICSLPVGCSKQDHGDWLRRGVAFHLKST